MTWLIQDSLFPAMERFVILKHLNVSFCDTTGEGAFFSDDAMRIDYVPILSDTNTNSSRNPNPSLRDSSDFLDESSNCMIIWFHHKYRIRTIIIIH